MLKVELFREDLNAWVLIGNVTTETIGGSMSDNKPNGRRDIYFFDCLGDKSVIKRSVMGADAESGPVRITATTGTEVIRELRDGEAYEITVVSDKSMGNQRKIRFTHQG